MARRKGDGFGFWGPLPSYSRSTNRGRVRVSGCCLPLTLAIVSVPVVSAGAAIKVVRGTGSAAGDEEL